jgi:FlaA1/EpsC-like NDP-sugar epimerase
MLDMREPVKIVDFARDMIRLSGLEERADIEVEFTGIGPGEKLYAGMFFSSEIAEPTEHPKVLRARNGGQDVVSDTDIAELIAAALGDTSEERLRSALKRLVPDFITTATPHGGVPSLTDPVPPVKRRGRPSGEMVRV